jgi:hypothetical protein
MNRYGSIYVITHTATGAQYVGQTRRKVAKRWDAHCRTAICTKARQSKFTAFLAEQTPSAFFVEEVYVAFDADALNSAEIALIAQQKSALNTAKGGAGHRGVVSTPEKRQRLSDAAKARWANPEWKANTVLALKAAHQTPEGVARGQALRAYKGVELRWAGHVKKPKPVCDKSAAIKSSWTNPEVRGKRIAGLRTAQAKPEVRARYVAASTGRIMPREAVESAARAKWKPVYCPELQVSFLCGKYAAEYFGVVRASVSNAVKQKGKLLRKYSLEAVA